MSRCPRCDAVAEADATTCGSCGQVLGGSAPSAVAARPAHLAVLDSVKAEAKQGEGLATTESSKPARPRIVSRAGPAVPVSNRSDDSVPSGASSWLSRLEAAKRGNLVAANAAPGGEKVDKPAPQGPPPLKKSAPKADNGKKKDSWNAKPAHLLVAELEAHEKEKKEKREAKRVLNAPIDNTAADEVSQSEIARHEIARPTARLARRKIPAWIWIPAVVISIGIAGGIAFYLGQAEPPPPAPAVDPELIAKNQRIKEAQAAIEEGHTVFQEAGDDKAKIDQAIAKYQRALELEPTLARAERALGVAFAKKGDDEKAVQHYRKFIELDPNNKEAPQIRSFIEKYEQRIKK